MSALKLSLLAAAVTVASAQMLCVPIELDYGLVNLDDEEELDEEFDEDLSEDLEYEAPVATTLQFKGGKGFAKGGFAKGGFQSKGFQAAKGGFAKGFQGAVKGGKGFQAPVQQQQQAVQQGVAQALQHHAAVAQTLQFKGGKGFAKGGVAKGFQGAVKGAKGFQAAKGGFAKGFQGAAKGFQSKGFQAPVQQQQQAVQQGVAQGVQQGVAQGVAQGVQQGAPQF